MSAVRSRAGEVLAGGGLVVRGAGAGAEVLVVHRPKYDDWSLPKGKLDPGEGLEAAALREVEEETGIRCRALRPIGDTVYTDSLGRPKRVRYWLMEPLAGSLDERPPDREIDEVRWVGLAEARRLLSYGRDRNLLKQLGR